MAQTPKLDVFWSPTTSKEYIVFGSEITLYRLEENILDNTESDFSYGPTFTQGTQLSQITDSQFPKCVAWCPEPLKSYLIAAGQHTGEVRLSSLDQRKTDPLIGIDLKPKLSRQCLAVAWGPNTNEGEIPLLAAGYDKCRDDFSLLVWDLNQPCKSLSSSAFNMSAISESLSYEPVHKKGNQECTYSLAWLSQQTLIAGINKYLRIVDFRDSRPYSETTQTKAVLGVCVDNQSSDQIVASFVEGQAYIWDIRKFDKPMHVLPNEKNPIVKIGWSPKRIGLLACLTKESSCIKVYDIQHYSTSVNDDTDQHFNQRSIPADQRLASFDWSPNDENRLLLINDEGNVADLTFHEQIAVDISARQELSIVKTKKLEIFSDFDQEDISWTMRQRAKRKYGLSKDLTSTLELVRDSYHLKSLWRWVSRMVDLSREESFSQVVTDCGTRLVGISRILEQGKAIKSRAEPMQWKGIDRPTSNIIQYCSFERDMCLKICNWPTKSDNLKSATHMLERNGKFEKAATLAVLYGQISDALDILNRGSESRKDSNDKESLSLTIIAMALSGMGTAGSRNSLWLSKCRELHSQITNAHLRACFSFLTSDDNFEHLLAESPLSVTERVAFACIFLPDQKLRDFISDLQAKVISSGDLSGIILTGMSVDGVHLLQQYVDKTTDVQTASLIAIHSLPNTQVASKDVSRWIENYQNILDQWRLWTERAELDIFYKQCDIEKSASHTPISELYLCCIFCSKAVIPNPIQQRKLYSNNAASKGFKISICHECRKPLPRCALCMKNMGTASGVLRNRSEDPPRLPRGAHSKVAPFDAWFTWCQKCHHGGHAIHIQDWFSENFDCPVSGCDCKCLHQDSLPLAE